MSVNSSDDTLATKFELNFNGQTFTLQKGDFVLVVGKSGSGKTALLLQMEEQLKALGQTTGFVFQNFDSQIVTDKVWHELSFALENTGVGRELMERRVGEMAAYFGISSWLGCKTENLSGGQKQLLNLAGTMALNPQFLLLDEPVSQLDPIAASNFLNTVKKLNRELGLTVVICEHRLEDIFSDADRVIFLDKMKILFDGEPGGFCRTVMASKSQNLSGFLPAAARIFARLGSFCKEGGTADIPVSVAEGRRWLFEKKDELKESFLTIKRSPKAKNPPFSENVQGKNCGKQGERESPCVKIQKLSFRYEKNSPWILQELNFNLNRSKIYAVVGANGSGKTTLLKILCSLLKPSHGTVKFQKKSALDSEKPKVCMLSQNVRNLFVKHTVLEELEDSGWKNDQNLVFDGSGRTLTEDILQKLILSLRGCFLRHPYDLSGGEMQKLALAKILLQKPDILLLDEPTKALDCTVKKDLSQLIKKLAEKGMTVVLVCHDLEFCACTADFTAMLFEGRLAGMDRTEAFFEKNLFYTTAAGRIFRGFEADFPGAAGVIAGEER
ncbi:ABC transporter ATP-binding protein [Treponema berlinense]|uniref:ABC transporter ATP-binding protein n=1 Tax=Treponema berlinense TaxID=225004 RepID=UPI0026EAE407|nr:ATP-binding cassette domain-containing protein [Treponema berlinense]